MCDSVSDRDKIAYLAAALRTDEGELFEWQCSTDAAAPPPQRVPMPIDVDHVACGAEHTCLLMSSGELFSFGSGKRGQTGLGTTENVGLPVRMRWRAPLSQRAASVCCGALHTAVLLDDGLLLTCGAADQGVLGHGSSGGTSGFDADERVHDVSELNPVSGFGTAKLPVASVSAGGSHNLALTRSNGVYAWGAGTFGALGLGDGVRELRRRPSTALPIGVPVVAIACGTYHSLALTESGAVFAWGWSRHGQLGDGGEGAHAFSPRAVGGLDGYRITAVCSGGHHVVARTTGAACLLWGANSAGQLGLGDFDNRATPTALPLSRLGGATSLQHVACGERHTAAVVGDGRVFGWGRGVDVASLSSACRPVALPALCRRDVSSLSCGSRSVVALTEACSATAC